MPCAGKRGIGALCDAYDGDDAFPLWSREAQSAFTTARPGFYKPTGKKGGETTEQRHGPQLYEDIGRKGGQTMRKLIEQGRRVQKGR